MDRIRLCIGRRYVQTHDTVDCVVALVRAHLISRLTIVILCCVRVRTCIGRHVRITHTRTAKLLVHWRTIGACHVVFTELLTGRRTNEFRRCICTRCVRHDLNRPRRLTLGLLRKGSNETLTLLVHEESIRTVLANLARILHRLANELLSTNHGALVGEFRIVRSTEVICTTDIVNHVFINLVLLEATLACSAELLSNRCTDLNGLERALTITTTHRRILHAALEEVSVILHTEGIAER